MTCVVYVYRDVDISKLPKGVVRAEMIFVDVGIVKRVMQMQMHRVTL